MDQWITETWNWMRMHPYLDSLLVLAAGAVLAKVTDILFTKVMVKLVSRTKTEVDDKIIAQMHRPVQLTIFLGALVMAMELIIVQDEWSSRLSRAFYSTILILWTMVAVRASRIFFKALIRRHRENPSLGQALPLLNNLILVLLLVHCAFWLFDIWQINVTPLLASAGIVTAAVALASKDTLANFFGGISVFVDQPYRVGDYIILDSGERGEVSEIGIRSTRILTRDDVLITVPNAVISNSKIINQSGAVPRFRVRADIGVGYDSDVDQVEEVLLSCLEGVKEILPYPAPRVRFRAFGESSLNFQLMAWIRRPGDRGRVLHEINRNLHKKLGAAGIDIPFPQRVLHFPEGGKKEGNPR